MIITDQFYDLRGYPVCEIVRRSALSPLATVCTGVSSSMYVEGSVLPSCTSGSHGREDVVQARYSVCLYPSWTIHLTLTYSTFFSMLCTVVLEKI